MPIFEDEKGTIMVLSLLMIALLSLIGVFSVQNSTIETRISRNDKLHKAAFHEAEGGTETGIQLLEHNIEERGFCLDASMNPSLDADGNCFVRGVGVDTDDPNSSSLRFYLNGDLPRITKPGCQSADCLSNDCPDNTSCVNIFCQNVNIRDAFIQPDIRNLAQVKEGEGCGNWKYTPPITNLMIGGSAELSDGAAIQMIAGYEGKGKGAASGGAHISYEIRSRHQGHDNSEATVSIYYRFVL